MRPSRYLKNLLDLRDYSRFLNEYLLPPAIPYLRNFNHYLRNVRDIEEGILENVNMRNQNIASGGKPTVVET